MVGLSKLQYEPHLGGEELIERMKDMSPFTRKRS